MRRSQPRGCKACGRDKWIKGRGLCHACWTEGVATGAFTPVRPHFWTEGEVAVLAECYRLPCRQRIAAGMRRLGMREDQVISAAKRFGLSRPRQAFQAHRRAVTSMVGRAWSLSQIAGHLGVSRSAVIKWVKRWGLKKPKRCRRADDRVRRLKLLSVWGLRGGRCLTDYVRAGQRKDWEAQGYPFGVVTASQACCVDLAREGPVTTKATGLADYTARRALVYLTEAGILVRRRGRRAEWVYELRHSLRKAE